MSNNNNQNRNNTLAVYEVNPGTNAKVVSAKMAVAGKDIEDFVTRYLIDAGITGIERVVVNVDTEREPHCVNAGIFFRKDSNAIENTAKTPMGMYADMVENRTPWRLSKQFERTLNPFLGNNSRLQRVKETGGVCLYLSETDTISMYMGVNPIYPSDYAIYINEAGYFDGEVQLIIEKVDKRGIFRKKKNNGDKYQKAFENSLRNNKRRY